MWRKLSEMCSKLDELWAEGVNSHWRKLLVIWQLLSKKPTWCMTINSGSQHHWKIHLNAWDQQRKCKGRIEILSARVRKSWDSHFLLHKMRETKQISAQWHCSSLAIDVTLKIYMYGDTQDYERCEFITKLVKFPHIAHVVAPIEWIRFVSMYICGGNQANS